MMFLSNLGKEAGNKSQNEKKTAKVAEVSNFEARPLRHLGGRNQNLSDNKNLIVLGISLSQPYSHGIYVAQMLEALKEKINQNDEATLGNPSWHLIVLLSTAYDPANNPDFDIENTNSANSLRAKASAEQEAEQWINTHTPTLDSYRCFFSYTIMSGDSCSEGEEYQQILSTFESAYTSGQICSDAKKAPCSLVKIDPQKKLNDLTFYNLIKKVIDAYVRRNSSGFMTKGQKKSLANRSQWIVLREYALIFMLSLGKIPSAFARDLSLSDMNYAYFAYPFGNFGKEVIHLFRNLFINDSLGAYNMGLYNIRLDDFCSKKNQDRKPEITSSPLTKENLTELQRLLCSQRELFSEMNQLSDEEKQDFLSYIRSVIQLDQPVRQFSAVLNQPVSQKPKPRAGSDLTDKETSPSEKDTADLSLQSETSDLDRQAVVSSGVSLYSFRSVLPQSPITDENSVPFFSADFV